MSTAVRRSLYGKLAGDTTLNALLGAAPTGYAHSIFYQEAPEGATFPFLVFSKSSGVPTWAFKADAMDSEVWMVRATDRSTSADAAEAIAARVDALLNDASLSISGRTLLYLRREGDIDFSEVTDGVKYAHSGATYRVISQPN